MPIQSIERSGTMFTLHRATDDYVSFDVVTQPGNEERKAALATRLLQAWFDVRQLLTDLPDDDPDKTVDPARPDLFWMTFQGNAYLVSRGVQVTVIWDGSDYQIRLRRVV